MGTICGQGRFRLLAEKRDLAGGFYNIESAVKEWVKERERNERASGWEAVFDAVGKEQKNGQMNDF